MYLHYMYQNLWKAKTFTRCTHHSLSSIQYHIIDAKPPENVLFVCKLNPVTDEEDLQLIFSRFDPNAKAEIIRDRETGDSLQVSTYLHAPCLLFGLFTCLLARSLAQEFINLTVLGLC